METSNELEAWLDRWRREIFGNSNANPVPILTSIAQLIERETEVYLKLPIDPFDDRHPSRTWPDCSLGLLLKSLFKNENFMTQLTSDYISTRASLELQTISSRLLLDILPGLDSSVVFKEEETLVKQLIEWAENAEFPLHSYATGLLAAAMEVADISSLYREKNNQLVPLMLNRLNQITHLFHPDELPGDNIDPRDLVDVKLNSTNKRGLKRSYSQLEQDERSNECSSSSWAEAYMSGSYQMHPLNVVMQQRFIVQYLSALGDYQELLVHMFEHKALAYILHFIDGRKNQDIRLAFDALKFLAALLSHKKFALEFLDHGGLPQLLRVNRHGMASSGVSICLYYLVHNEDVMERICWMKRETVERMVHYGLWLLECSHDSSRAHAAMFFSHCFKFPLLLRLFDKDNGVRKLLNIISMRGLFSDDSSIHDLSDDELFSRKQTVKQVCIALKKYIRAHFLSGSRNEQECKPISITDEDVMRSLELHREQSSQRHNWRAIDRILQEEGIIYLLKSIAHIYNEGFILTGKSETAKSALEILVVCSLSSKVQHLLLKEVIRTAGPYPIDQPAIAVIVMWADPKIYDSDCQKAALNIMINLVCCNQPARVPPPVLNTSTDHEIVTPSTSRKKGQSRTAIDLTSALRKAVWANNGTLILPKLLTVTTKLLTEADTIRSLACCVLCGLVKEESIRQIMSKLPLFTDGQLLSLMKKPILQEKKMEHASFCRYCKELIELVTGTPVTSISGVEPSLAEIKRKMIVAKTRIQYDQDEAFQLIYDFLISKGCLESAAAVYKETNLASKASKQSVASNLPRLQQARSPPPSGSNNLSICNHSVSQSPVNPNSPGPVRFKVNFKTPTNGSFSVKSSIKQKSALQTSHLYKKLFEPPTSTPVTLDSILTDYLRHQHSMCENPVSTCPVFSLSTPHQCPKPKNTLSAPLNIAMRILKRKVNAPRGGINGAKFDRNFVYSKFRPVRLVRDSAEYRTSSTCCAFSKDSQYLFVGTDNGMMKAFNINSGLVDTSYECHMNELGYIETSSDDSLLITTSPDSASPQCVLWSFTDVFERKHRFDNDLHAEFGKASSDRIVTTQELYARLWDTATGSLIRRYDCCHRYSYNRATLNYSDTLLLNDGVLWDVRSPSSVYEFGRFEDRINGIFHPNGNEIICNTHIWDVRNYRLLNTVPAFDMCQLKFNSLGDVIFSTILDDQSEVTSKIKNEFKTSFRTFDSHDYSTIATIDLKRTISDLAVSSADEYIALVESSGNIRCFHEEYSSDSNVCRLYEIGRPKYDADIDCVDDEDGDDEENDEDDDDDDDDDDDAGPLDYDEEDFDDDPYDTDSNEEEEEDDDDTSASNLSSSEGSNSVASRDEIVPFSFQRSSDMEDEDDVREGSTSEEDDDSHAYP